MQYETLVILWYVVVGVAMVMYMVLDGFDLGVGALHLCTKSNTERRIFLNAIGPVWDGNEVWLVIILGSLFAGFPIVYASILSGYYTLIMFLIPGLMFRAAAIEFRSKSESKTWRKIWDGTFCLSSILVTFVLGIFLGNFVTGIPLNSDHQFNGSIISLFQPYAVIVALFAVSLVAMHGSIFLVMKTEGKLQEKLRHWTHRSIVFFLFFFFVTTLETYIDMPHMFLPFEKHPQLISIPIMMLLTILSIPLLMRKGREGIVFIASCFSIMLLLTLFGIGTFPYLVMSTVDTAANSLTIYNSASSQKTLEILLVIVLIGVPLVLAYGYWIYHIFRGKVKLDENSY